MIISGQFRDVDNSLITVTINSNKTGNNITIGENGLYFTGDPVVISWSIDESFEHIIRKSCTINLTTENYLGDKLFSFNSRDITVTVNKGNSTIFSGYLSPNTYNQPFVKGLDTFELQAVDYLSTLQYYNYNNTTVKNYNDNKATISTVTFKSILQGIFGNRNIYYDKSKGISSSGVNTVFQDISINDSIFYGDDADDLKTQEEVLETILKYLNLHIIQEGNNFFIFDWDSIKNGTIDDWYNIIGNYTTNIMPSSTVNINKDLFAAADTNISIADVYNQIGLTCNLEAQETVIESPLSNDNISPLYNAKMKYMTEYISNGNGDSANDAFNTAVKGNTTDYDGFKTVDWYCQVMQNPKWKFNVGSGQTIENIADTDASGNYINQYKIPLYLKNNQCKPALIRFGSITTEGGENKDNNPQSKIEMKNYLFISVNGNEANTTSCSPTESTLQSAAPLIEYIDYSNGGNFSPADSKTTNYLVFSGKILLQPVAYETGVTIATRQNTYQTLQTNNARKYEGESPGCPIYENASDLHNNLVSNDYDDDGRYYTRKFYYDNPSNYINAASLQPWTANKGEKGYEYKYSATGDSSDKYSKLPILECELIIGNKRLIETNIDMYGNSTFQWVTVGQEPTIDGQVKTTFSLGVNPKIGDKIIGTEFNIQNTISYELNIDAEGTGIPITRDDAINGQVTFRILGLVNTLWSDVTRRDPIFWILTNMSTGSRPILAHTENIIIEDFQCRLYSDNALNSNDGSDELVYKSAESDNYITSKDDIEFDIITQLTSDECLAKGITTAANKNAALLASNGLTLHDIYNHNTGETDIAEKHYIDQYYREYSIPRMILETTIHGTTTLPTIYNWDTLNKEFMINGMETDLRMNTTKLSLKEI